MKKKKENIKQKQARKPVDVIIDCEADGFAIISKMEPGKKKMLLRLPLGSHSERSEILKQLLCFALKREPIRQVIAHRYFLDTKSLHVFQSLDLRFLIPFNKA